MQKMATKFFETQVTNFLFKVIPKKITG